MPLRDIIRESYNNSFLFDRSGSGDDDDEKAKQLKIDIRELADQIEDQLASSSEDAVSTYETKAHAAATYETQSHASSTYETQSHASSTYETQTHAAATYATASTVNSAIAGISKVGPPLLTSSSGTVPYAAGDVYLQSGSNTVEAYMGCQDPSHAATLKVYRTDNGALVATIGGVASGLTSRSGTFTAPVSGWYELTLETNNANGVALLRGIKWS